MLVKKFQKNTVLINFVSKETLFIKNTSQIQNWVKLRKLSQAFCNLENHFTKNLTANVTEQTLERYEI